MESSGILRLSKNLTRRITTSGPTAVNSTPRRLRPKARRFIEFQPFPHSPRYRNSEATQETIMRPRDFEDDYLKRFASQGEIKIFDEETLRKYPSYFTVLCCFGFLFLAGLVFLAFLSLDVYRDGETSVHNPISGGALTLGWAWGLFVGLMVLCFFVVFGFVHPRYERIEVRKRLADHASQWEAYEAAAEQAQKNWRFDLWDPNDCRDVLDQLPNEPTADILPWCPTDIVPLSLEEDGDSYRPYSVAYRVISKLLKANLNHTRCGWRSRGDDQLHLVVRAEPFDDGAVCVETDFTVHDIGGVLSLEYTIRILTCWPNDLEVWEAKRLDNRYGTENRDINSWYEDEDPIMGPPLFRGPEFGHTAVWRRVNAIKTGLRCGYDQLLGNQADVHRVSMYYTAIGTAFKRLRDS